MESRNQPAGWEALCAISRPAGIPAGAGLPCSICRGDAGQDAAFLQRGTRLWAVLGRRMRKVLSRVCTGALDPKPADPNVTSPCSETPAGLSQVGAGAQSRRERSLVVSRSNASAPISSQDALIFLFPVCLRECFAVRDPSPWCLCSDLLRGPLFKPLDVYLPF